MSRATDVAAVGFILLIVLVQVVLPVALVVLTCLYLYNHLHV